MKIFNKIINPRLAKSASGFMKIVCYIIICFYILCLILSFMGRQIFFLHSADGTFPHAIYAEENHDPQFRTFTVSSTDDIHVWTNENNQIDLKAQLGISCMYAVNLVPMAFAYLFLSRVFSNVSKGEIFSEKNAVYLLYFGLIQFLVALLSPFIKLLICNIINVISSSRISIATGSGMINDMIPSIAFIVAAYIIHHGIALQDEVDHTL